MALIQKLQNQNIWKKSYGQHPVAMCIFYAMKIEVASSNYKGPTKWSGDRLVQNVAMNIQSTLWPAPIEM